MERPVFIFVPANNQILLSEIQIRLAPYIRIDSTPYRDLNNIKLVLEIVGQTIGIAGGVAGVLTYLQNTRDRAAQSKTRTDIMLSKPGEDIISLDDADDVLLRKLLEIS